MKFFRIETFLTLIVAGIGLVLAVVFGLFSYASVTTPTLHPDPAGIPSEAEGPAPSGWADALDRARALARTAIVEQNVPGLSIAVGVDDAIVWSEGFGWADLEQKTPITSRTLFRIGTASKVLTSVAVAMLVEEGRLNLDNEIQAYVPEFPKKPWPVTVRQLMAHTAGLRGDGGDEEPLSVHCDQTLGALDRFGNSRLLFEPGTRYHYTNYGWILVSAAVEAAANQSLYAFMRRRVFEPLGMEHTRADSSVDPVSGRSSFYFPRFAADPRYGLQPPRDVDYSCFSGSANFLSTSSDLVRFGLAITGGRLLQPETVRLLQTSQRLPSGEATGYGLGWDLESIALNGRPAMVVGHDGEVMGGPVASLMVVPDRGLVVAVTSNTAYTDTFGLASKIANVFAESAKPAAVP